MLGPTIKIKRHSSEKKLGFDYFEATSSQCMEFGKLNNIDTVDFSMPAPDTSLLSNTPASTLTIYYGCTGWSSKDWVGHWYPKGTKPSQFLEQYAKQFNTIELNTTHYRIPRAETMQLWYHSTPEGFQFCPKIPQTISHSKDLGLDNIKTRTFCNRMAILREKLGVIFMQCPPYFTSSSFPMLELFLRSFPTQSYPLAIELRHKSWFDSNQQVDKLGNVLHKYNVSLLHTDVAGRRDVLHLKATNKASVIRCVGNGLHPTDYERIDDWVFTIKKLYEAGQDTIYFFSHQPDHSLEPELCIYFRNALEKILPVSFSFFTEPVRDNQLKLF